MRLFYIKIKHKQFSDSFTSAHTYNVKRLNNCFLCGIKAQMGVKIECREVYLNWFYFHFNSKSNFPSAVIEFI